MEQIQTHDPRFRDDFPAIGAEWVILTPHYVRPDWMGLNRERDIDEDPARELGAGGGPGLRDVERRSVVAGVSAGRPLPESS